MAFLDTFCLKVTLNLPWMFGKIYNIFFFCSGIPNCINQYIHTLAFCLILPSWALTPLFHFVDHLLVYFMVCPQGSLIVFSYLAGHLKIHSQILTPVANKVLKKKKNTLPAIQCKWRGHIFLAPNHFALHYHCNTYTWLEPNPAPGTYLWYLIIWSQSSIPTAQPTSIPTPIMNEENHTLLTWGNPKN